MARWDSSYTGGWRVFDRAEPVKLIPVRSPDEVNGFRYAHPFDGFDDNDGPYVSPERGYITDPAEHQRLLGYFAAATQLGKQGITYGDDLLQPTRKFAIPALGFTDGAWIWAASVEFYLRWHRLAPEPDFYRHIVAHGYTCPPVSIDKAAAAMEALAKLAQIRAAAERAWLAEHGLLREGDPDRFPDRVNQELRKAGWYKGRDASDVIKPWLDKWTEALPTFPIYKPKHPYRLFDTVVAVLREFGGLRLDVSDGFVFFPDPYEPPDDEFLDPYDTDLDDLGPFVYAARDLSNYLDTPVFQIGATFDGVTAIFITPDSRVYTLGENRYHVADTFDEALTKLINDDYGQPLPEFG